ncbi:hypothetical protein NQ315_009304 [Exocentrus adspersus]|uniref:Very long-chain fatty acid transport protein n=1 Tax=Exocentrus adspersus TaxID=1586481 RepID=A0AAV8WH57_9CUCU|nr:hypothetical protein NQ315_009304 [Exocentrus adspersus]
MYWILLIVFLLTWFLFTGKRDKWLYILYRTLPRDLIGGYRFLKLNSLLHRWDRDQETIPKLFTKLVTKHPQKIAFYYEDQSWTFQQLEDFSNKIAHYFKEQGYKSGETVTLLLENRPEYVGIWLGLSKIGVVTALINTNLVSDPLLHSIMVANSDAIIYGEAYAKAICDIKEKLLTVKLYEFNTSENTPSSSGSINLNRAIETEPTTSPQEDIALTTRKGKVVYIYTSGTTGLPKAAVISHSRYMFTVAGAYIMTNLNENDIYYNPLPLYHSAGGMVGVGQTILFGVTVVIRKKFSASSFWSDCKKYKCTVANYIGEICRYILAAHKPGTKVDHPVKKVIGNGLRPQIWKQFVSEFQIDHVYEFYGSTEGNTNLMNIDGTLGAVGFVPRYASALYPVTLIRCDEDTNEPIRNENGFCIRCQPGEGGLLVGKINPKRTVSEFSGYADKKATSQKVIRNVFKKGDAYFNSGDLLVQDELGYYYFKDRTGDTFRWKGENVATNEVEAVLTKVIGLKDTVVYGVEIPGSEGRAGMAAVIDKDKTLNVDELAKGLKSQLPGYAIPLFLRIMDSFPVTGTFKVKKIELQKDGYDVHKITDPLYIYDAKNVTYVPLAPVYDDVICYCNIESRNQPKCLYFIRSATLSYLANRTSLMDKFVRPVFTLELNYKIVPGLVTLGKYDGAHPCVTAATSTDKSIDLDEFQVLIHSPHRKNPSDSGRLAWSETNREIATLNVNHTISSLATGQLLPNDEKDVLIIGTSTHILAYHVHDNKDVFYKECEDGVKSITIGTFRDKSPVVMVGGNSSVHGYDHLGNEIFWTAVGDVVTSMILMDYNKDGSNELVVSSEDFNIRVFKGDQVIAEHVETEVVTNLVPLPENRFAYSVSNGTVGVYEQDVRLWRVKSKNFAIAMHPYDLLGQSSMQLITGWSNGKIDCRAIKTGEVLFKDAMTTGVAGIVEGDYRSVGKTDVICVASEGEVRGYTTTKTLSNSVDGSGNEQDLVRELLAQKQALMMELKHYEGNTRYNENVLNETESYENSGVIPASTRLQIAVNTDDTTPKPHIEVYISTNNSTIIRAVIIFAEGIFKGETHVVHPPASKLSSEISIPLTLPKDNPVDIHIKALVGYPNSIQFHVFEITRKLPTFSMYAQKESVESAQPDGFVQFKVNERLQRICMWINQNFLFSSDIEFDSGPNLTLNLKCLRDGSPLIMVFEISGKVVIHTNNMFLAADLVQSLAAYLNIENLESKASFPNEEENLKMLMEKLTSIQDARIRLSTDVADRLGQIRHFIIKAEDSRLNNIKEMPTYYSELNAINKELINGYKIRLQNYNEGVETMKRINAIIQKASRLRVGQKSSTMISNCRKAIENNNIEGLIKIIRSGEL